MTTTSLPALKAYLEGQALYRRGDFDNATAAYERAVEADSTFALAYYGMGEAWSMSPGFQRDKVMDSFRRALSLVDRLPEREVMLVRATTYYSGADPYRALEILHRAVQQYPDDPEAWYRLADTYVHYGGQILAEDVGNWQELMERAVELDPSFPSIIIHLAEDAFLRADSARAANWTQRYDRIAPDDPSALGGRLAFSLAFGDASTRARAAAMLDTLDTVTLEAAAGFLIGHPRFFTVAEELLVRSGSRPDATPFSKAALLVILIQQGKIRTARGVMNSPQIPRDFRAVALYMSRLLLGNSVVPSEELQHALSIAAADTVTWLFAGADAAAHNRWEGHSAAIHRLRKAARDVIAAGDSAQGRIFGGAADAVEGYGQWRRGKPAEAARQLENARGDVVSFDYPAVWNATIRYWLGLLFLEVDQPQQAAKYFESMLREHYNSIGATPFAAYELAKIRERQGRKVEAIEAYEYALLAWRNADPELRPRIEAARRAITRLSGAED